MRCGRRSDDNWRASDDYTRRGTFIFYMFVTAKSLVYAYSWQLAAAGQKKASGCCEITKKNIFVNYVIFNVQKKSDFY